MRLQITLLLLLSQAALAEAPPQAQQILRNTNAALQEKWQRMRGHREDFADYGNIVHGGGDIVASAVEIIYGGRALVLKPGTTTVVGGRRLTLVQKAGGLFFVVDGIARAYLAMNGKEPTLLPLASEAIWQMGLAEYPDSPPPQEIAGQGKYSAWQVLLGFGEVISGATVTFAAAPGIEMHKAIRIGAPLVWADGFLRLMELSSGKNSSLIPLTDYAWEKLRKTPFAGSALEAAANRYHEESGR